MRLPRAGGPLRVLAYPRLDSVVWSSTDPAPSISRVLAFDEEAGLLSFVDAKGVPARVDFRLDNVGVATRTRLTGVSSVDGATIYGLTKDGSLLRSTPSGDWTFKAPRPARAAIPLSDGSLLLVASKEHAAIVWRLRPPDTKILRIELGSMHTAPFRDAPLRYRLLPGFPAGVAESVGHPPLARAAPD